MRGSNPVFRSVSNHVGEVYDDERSASYAGVAIKTGILLATLILSGITFVLLLFNEIISADAAYIVLGIAFVSTFVLCIISMFSRSLGAVWGILYSIAEGILLGVVTGIVELLIPGIAAAAMIGTISVFLVMLFLYMSKTIRVTSKFVRFMSIFGISILVSFLIFGILNLFAGSYMSAVTSSLSSPWFFILICIGFILYGAFMLILQFDSARMIVEGGADKRVEWQVAVGFMLALVWIYMEILRLLVIIMSRAKR